MAQTSSPPPHASLDRSVNGRPRFFGCSKVQEYEFLGKLGEGTFGEVSKAKSTKTGALVALKKILMHNEKDGFPITALREIKLLKQLDHVNVLKLEEMAVDHPKGDRKTRFGMFMVTPYMEHDLSGLLENPDVHFTVPQIKCYMLQLLEGVKYMHENKILHRDMKAANLLINNQGILQIADFGLARPYDDDPPKPGQGGGEASRDYTTLVVTRWYRPPELLLQLRRYTTAIDLWGVGCVFGEMFRGKPILAGSSDLNQAQLIFDLVGSPNDENMPGWSSLPGVENIHEFAYRPNNIAKAFRDTDSLTISLLTELLKLDWRKRINAIDALKHPYFRAAPFPAKPHELPRFDDSHELDRRKYRKDGKPAALPPAPAGGSVGMGPNGEWAVRDGQQRGPSRVPNNYVNGHGGPPPPPRHRGPPPPPPPPYDSRHDINNHQGPPPPPYHSQRAPPPPPPPHDDHRIPAWQRDGPSNPNPNLNSSLGPGPPPGAGLPPKPPPSTHHHAAWNGDGPPPYHRDRDNHHRPPYRDRDRPPPRANGAGGGGGGGANIDTYIPSYDDDDRAPPPRRDERDRDRDWPPPHRRDDDRLDWDRDRDRDMGRGRDRGGFADGRRLGPDYARRRSRSPDWDRDRDRRRDRDRDRDGGGGDVRGLKY
ncbi:MAG: hypothetical protein Q9160_002364 [Pyrenula sp. 1 TL-2023]